MLIGYTDKMQDSDVACLADWADYHAKEVNNPTWKRAFSLIREGADLLLRHRAMHNALSHASHPFSKDKVPKDGN